MTPLIGALLRRAHGQVRRRVMEHLRTHGFADVRSSEFVLFQYPPPDGITPTTLAAERGLSKQLLNHLLRGMERRGYLRRRPDPDDRRSVVIVPTARGRRLIGEMRHAAEEIERLWRRRLGARRFASVRRALEQMAGE